MIIRHREMIEIGYSSGMEGVSIVTTCYNELENLELLISAIREVMSGFDLRHEIIVVDDSSPDGSYEVARKLADVAIQKKREGQTKGLMTGIMAAMYSTIITIDSDLENEPRHIPKLLEALKDYDVVVASRDRIPRVSERLFSWYYEGKLGVRDILSNFRAFEKRVAESIILKSGETYGAEFLIMAKAGGYRLGQIDVRRIRRARPRLGNNLTANLKIFVAFFRCLLL